MYGFSLKRLFGITKLRTKIAKATMPTTATGIYSKIGRIVVIGKKK